MLSLSSQILGEILEICKTRTTGLARCQWAKVNDHISPLRELKDFSHLQWLFNIPWQSRDWQSTRGHDVMLALSACLVQASFMRAGIDSERKLTIHLAEDLAYNVRLTALYYRTAIPGGKGAKGAAAATCAEKATPTTSRSAEMASLYFKKIVKVHEDILRLLLDSDTELTTSSACDPPSWPQQ
ncbi:hypothetical protein BD289DRAFT_482251 [Coniella lustricola]|uniref:Uncharacterized protein n=1 Tax=Coniella lustricola TaxID=2025994 RepID=A0A2T3A9L4_9PEZI|nr:hypothetical protein BD289DRAFT_482251 [Coniella lustricola]